MLRYADNVASPVDLCHDYHWFDAGRVRTVQNFKVIDAIMQRDSKCFLMRLQYKAHLLHPSRRERGTPELY